MALRPIETPQEYVRTALHLLGELEDQLCVVGLIMPERHYLVRLLAATRHQLWLAVAALESQRDRPRWWVRPRRLARKRGRAVMILPEVVAWGALAVGFALNCVWRCTRAAMRLVHMLRVLGRS